MKSSDYQTRKQAMFYSKYRFQKGLSWVSRDEFNVLNNYLGGTNLGGKVFIDLGSGTGRIINILLKQNPGKIYAVDESKAMLNELKKNYPKEVRLRKIQQIITSADDTSLKGASADLITAFHLVKHLPDIAPTLKEVSRLLKNQGNFIFDALNENSLIRFNIGTCFAASEADLSKSLYQNGMQVKKVFYLHPLGETIYNLPVFFLPFVRAVERLINLTFPKMGTKILIKATKV